MTLKLSRCVRVSYLRMCAKFHGSMTERLRENPFGGGLKICNVRIFLKFSSKFFRVKFLFLNQHVPNRLSLPADDWRQHPQNPSLSRFEFFSHTQTFCGKPELLYTTQYSDLFVSYQESFNMHTGQPNPQPKINEYISGKIVLDSTTKPYVSPALKVSNNFATLDYDAHNNTKKDYTINNVFRSMTV